MSVESTNPGYLDINEGDLEKGEINLEGNRKKLESLLGKDGTSWVEEFVIDSSEKALNDYLSLNDSDAGEKKVESGAFKKRIKEVLVNLNKSIEGLAKQHGSDVVQLTADLSKMLDTDRFSDLPERGWLNSVIRTVKSIPGKLGASTKSAKQDLRDNSKFGGAKRGRDIMGAVDDIVNG